MTKQHKSVTEMTVAELIKQFDKDIVYDSQTLSAKIRQSEAGSIICQKGTTVLDEVASHLEDWVNKDDPHQVKLSWSKLLWYLEMKNKLPALPQDLFDTEGIITWCRENATS